MLNKIEGSLGKKVVNWELNSDINILYGDNGTGKTYLLDAIKDKYPCLKFTWDKHPVPIITPSYFTSLTKSPGQIRWDSIIRTLEKVTKPCLYIIDDADLHLFVDKQRILIKELYKVRTDCQLILVSQGPCIGAKYLDRQFDITHILKDKYER